MLSRIGFVDSEKFVNWCRSYEGRLGCEKWNGKVNSSGRKDLWFGVGVSLGFKNELFEGEFIGNGLRERCNSLWGNCEWNSLLLYKYEFGVELKDHRDRELFGSKVVVINWGEVDFRYGGRVYELGNGEVICFDPKVIHGVGICKGERWSLSIRKVKV